MKNLGFSVWKITILRQNIIFFPIAEGGAKIFWVFRVKNHDFTPKNLIFSNFRGVCTGCAPPPGSAPDMVFGFTATYAISAYHHWCCEVESRSGCRWDVLDTSLCVSDLRQVGGFPLVSRFPLPIKLTTTIKLKYCWKWRLTPSNKQTNKHNDAYALLSA